MDTHEVHREAEALYCRHANTFDESDWQEAVQREAPCTAVREEALRIRREVDALLSRLAALEEKQEERAALLSGLATADPPVFRALQHLLGATQAHSRAPSADDLRRPCIDGYELLEELGRGGMGVVYKAHDRRLKRDVALKVIAPALLDRSEAVSRFEREMEAVARLDHPNVVRVWHAGEVSGRHYLVMELVDGGNLAAQVRRRSPLPVAEAAQLARQAALGLQQVHECKVVHRDVKPSNFLMTTKGVLKLVDFGLAKLGDRLPGGDGATNTGALLGTRNYLAPEQAKDPRQADARSDLYGLGCTMYFLLTGQDPFADFPSTSKEEAHARLEVLDIAEARPEVPPGLAALVRRLMSKRPEERFASAAKVAVALEPFCPNWAPPERDRTRRALRWFAVAGLVAAVLLGLVALRNWPAVPVMGIKPLRVMHHVKTPNEKGARVGHQFGEEVDSARVGDVVTVTAELTEQGYCYLIGFNFDGKEQLLWPTDEQGHGVPQQKPAKVARVRYPPGEIKFDLDDDEVGGLQVFVLDVCFVSP